MIGASLLLSGLPLFFILSLEGGTQGTLLFCAGYLITIPDALIVIMVQVLFPQKKGIASGLVLGFMFFNGSVGSVILGYTADRIGLETMLGNLWVLGLIAAMIAFLITD